MEKMVTPIRLSTQVPLLPRPVSAFRLERGFVVLILLTTVMLSLFAVGCGASRAGRFEAFARAGHHYSTVRNSFLEQSLETSIARDTMELRLMTDDEDDAAERLNLLKEHDEGMRARMEIIRDLERHAQVRDLYFAALADLAGSKTTMRAGQAANALAGQIESMGGQIGQRTLLGQPVGQLVGKLTGAAVGSFRNRALEQHLQTHAATIERELAIEEELIERLSAIMISDLEALRQARRREEIIAPLVRDEALPSTWNRTRQRSLLSEFDVGKLDAAKQAAAELRQSYRLLVEGDGQGIALNTVQLEFAMQRLADAVASVRETR